VSINFYIDDVTFLKTYRLSLIFLMNQLSRCI